MTTLTATQLNVALTSEQIGEARTRSVTPPAEGQPVLDPVAEEITAACAKVDQYITGWLLAESLATAYARDLAAWAVAKRLSKPTAEQDTAKDRALKELEDIRDGKFPGIERDPEATVPTRKILSGSKGKAI